MNNIKLTGEQLKELAGYIKTKGFKDPAIINEILDHFACKVEEEMEIDSSLSFYDAVHKARNSFGVMGFAPIAASFTKQLRSRYRKVYWKNFWQTASAPLHIPLLLVLGYGCFKCWLWANAHNYQHLMDMNDVSAILTLGYVIAQAVIMYKEETRKNLYKQTAFGVVWFFPWMLIYIMPHSNRPNIPVWVSAFIIGILSILAVLQLIALRATMKAAAADYNEVEQFFNA
ncbi:MAG: hypothetical protein JSS96_12835 [Bacteroidetes bacterium]|nr:hypothetical protein [Bacteroidota bacterium]